MKIVKKSLAVILTALMLLSMIPAMATPCWELDKECQYGDWYVVKKATNCQTWDGLKERKCRICGDTYQDEITGDHVYGSWKTTKKATCESKGKKVRTCKLCGHQQTASISKADHSYGSWTITEEPTCTEKGEQQAKCKVCGKTGYASVKALGHNWGEWMIVVEATEFSAGLRECTCQRCGEVMQEEYYVEGTLKNGDMNSDTVKELQEALNKAGHNCGNADGDFGPKTEAGLKSWQEDNGYEPDGIAWPGQVEEILGLGAELFCGITRNTAPANGPAYMAGEEVRYTFNALNTGDETIYNVNLYFVDDSGMTSKVISEALEPGETFFTYHDRIVNESDVEYGSYTCSAYAEGTDEDGEPVSAMSESITILCGEKGTDVSMYDAELVKKIVNAPANGMYFTAGETIEYSVEFINLCNHELYDVEVTDPIKGANEDMTLIIEPVVEPLSSVVGSFSYTVTEADAEIGILSNIAHARWWNPEISEPGERFSNCVQTELGVDAEVGALVLTKSLVGAPANGEAYAVGEEITFAVALENTTQETFSDVIIYDPILEPAELKPYDVVEPGFVDSIEFTYVVTEEDAAAGFVENTAFAMIPADNELGKTLVYSNTVKAPCMYRFVSVGDEEITVGGIEVTKSEASSPANGTHYTPGETVTFRIDVKNTMAGRELAGVVVDDTLMAENGGVWSAAALAPGAADSFTFGYVVSPVDAVTGSISNIAVGSAYDADGNRYTGVSNTVTVAVGTAEDAPFGVITDLDIVKEETSAPANGTYYTEGETISYRITYTNIGETRLGETVIYDTLNAGGGDIASAEMLSPGESRSCTFSHTVTAADVAKGYVANSAIAQYNIGGGYTGTARSNVVVSDTDGDPNTTYVEGFGRVDWEKVRGTEEAVEDTCYIEVVSRSGSEVGYEAHFCTEHAKTQESIMTMANASEDANRKQMAWEYGYALWQKDIGGMYEEILAGCDDDAKIVVMSERVNYLAMVANTQFARKIADPGKAEETARAVADLWQSKCIDLCYLMNTAPEKRVDGVFGVARTEAAAEAAEKCFSGMTGEGENCLVGADRYCLDHSFIYDMTEVLLKDDGSEDTWNTVRSLWEIELNNAYNALYKEASEEGGMAYLAEYATYMNWLANYENVMKAAYPDQPEIVAEIMVNVMMERVLTACGRMN